MQVIEAISLFIRYAVGGVAIAVIVLMLVRLALNYADLNPFNRSVLFVRRLSDPLVNPVRRSLLQFGFGPNIAPLVTILIVILLGYFVWLLSDSILRTVGGIVVCVQALPRRQSAAIAIVGLLLYGFLEVYSLLIFIRIIFSWGNISPSNRLMRFLLNATDPVLVPLRRILPPFGMFDLSPIVAFIIIWLLKEAVSIVLIAGFFPR